ncbi:573_t:CDS:1, partial [Racocetra fulgida]
EKPYIKKEGESQNSFRPKREYKGTRKNFQGKPLYQESKESIKFSNPNNVGYKPPVPKQFNSKKREYGQDDKYQEEIHKRT